MMLSQFFAGCFLALSQQDITLPESIKVSPATFVAVTAQTKGEIVVFVTLDPGLSVFPSNLLVDRKTTVVVAAKEGRYRMLAYTSIENKPSQPAFTTIIVGNPGPDVKPPDVKPPDVKPPDVKPPDVKPPDPDSPLFNTLLNIYRGLQEEDKAVNVKRLAQVYELAIVEADNLQYKNLGQLYASIRTNAVTSMKNDKIVQIRQAIGDYLSVSVGTDASRPLDAQTRTNCKNAFKLIATILGGLNG